MAFTNQSMEIGNLLMSQGAATYNKDVHFNPILFAIRFGSVEAVKTLVSEGVAIDHNHADYDPICLAVDSGNVEMVKLVVSEGARIHNIQVQFYHICLALELGNVEMVKTLASLGADMQEALRYFLLQDPIAEFKLDFVMLMIELEANVNFVCHDTKETPLLMLMNHKELTSPIRVEVAKALIAKGAEVNVKNFCGKTPIDGAIDLGDDELCKLLLLEGAEIVGTGMIKEDNVYRNPFEILPAIIVLKRPELVQLCLERGGDYNFQHRHGLTPYHFALGMHNLEMVKLFWKFGCPYDQPKNLPGTLKTISVYKPNAEYRKVLNIQKQFMAGIKKNKVSLVLNALDLGAEPRGCSQTILSPLHYLAAKDWHEVAKLLLERGVPVNRVEEKSGTPLNVAVKIGAIQVCKIFLQYGACYSYNSVKATKRKSLIDPLKNFPEIYVIFKKINRLFQLTKQNNIKVLNELHKCIKSQDVDTLSIMMNCVNRKGCTLMGVALNCGHMKLAQQLMKIRLETM